MSDLWRLHVLVCCCTAKQYSEITSIFSKISNRRARSRGEIIKLLEDLNLLIDGITETVKYEIKDKRVDFFLLC